MTPHGNSPRYPLIIAELDEEKLGLHRPSVTIIDDRAADDAVLDEDLQQRIRDVIRRNTTPRHVPAKIIQVTDIPRTISGKTVEIAVRNILHDRPGYAQTGPGQDRGGHPGQADLLNNVRGPASALPVQQGTEDFPPGQGDGTGAQGYACGSGKQQQQAEAE